VEALDVAVYSLSNISEWIWYLIFRGVGTTP
jgi:hypothetical protein